MRFSPKALAAMRAKLDLPDDADGTAILAAVSRRLDELAEDPPSQPRAPAVAPAQPDIVAWGLATGRYSAPRAEFWARRADAERSRTGSAARTEAEIRSLSPVYEPPADRAASSSPWVKDPVDGHMVRASWTPASGSETPLLDAFDEAMFGPSVEVQRRRDDLAAEASLAEALVREREAAAQPGLTEDEHRALFGPDEQD